ncbi:PWWP domain-containing DNA repair factor 3A isoform X2 [Melanotaenia boesemani]|uniref:PWWP domain-containing DNA repair factor 3A isoform X2 n=1 Tax=Melanotaenia boesemani TaxID=1250792 RepID=UPI001C05BEA6|nr:PWWP domain-containing DNA repair factor 3A isoform X2 [Melanotaenia boesemani]
MKRKLPDERTEMKGGSRKTRKREPKKTCADNVTTDTVLSAGREKLNIVASSDLSTLSQSALSSLTSTPKRGKGPTRQIQEASLTSTPVHILSNISDSPPGVNEFQLQFTEPITQPTASETDSPCFNSKIRRRRSRAFQPRQVKQRAAKEQTQADGSTVKRGRGRPRNTATGDLKRKANTQPSKRLRPRVELNEFTVTEEESLLSSDLSIELSHHENPTLSPLEDEKSEEEEEEDFPSFMTQMDKKPPSITEGTFVWCKYRSYPFWPALVKSVNRKQKKASIVFIEDTIIQKKKGFGCSLKSLKPFDCEDAEELIKKAKELYDAVITWSLELIKDYRFRIACGSFSGSFIEYFNHDMSYPVRRKCPQAASDRLAIASHILMEEPCDDIKEESFNEKHADEHVCGSSKRLLPDRTHAAHNRANEKLVQFIVKQHMVEQHLLAVIRGQQQSRWLRAFLNAKRRRVVNIYLEDDKQLDQVYWYLSDLYTKAVDTAPHPSDEYEHVPFVLDVLLPEAIICAIAGVENVPVKKAEEKYLRGRCISNRERQEFDLMIEREMMRKSQHHNEIIDVFSDLIT